MSPESLTTTIVGGLAILGVVVRYARKAWRFMSEWIDTMQSLRDLTETFVRSVVEDEQRFQRIERYLNLPDWDFRRR